MSTKVSLADAPKTMTFRVNPDHSNNSPVASPWLTM